MAKRTWFGLLFRSDIMRVPEVIQKSAGVMWCCCVGFAGAVVWWCGGVSVWCFGVVVVPGVCVMAVVWWRGSSSSASAELS